MACWHGTVPVERILPPFDRARAPDGICPPFPQLLLRTGRSEKVRCPTVSLILKRAKTYRLDNQWQKASLHSKNIPTHDLVTAGHRPKAFTTSDSVDCLGSERLRMATKNRSHTWPEKWLEKVCHSHTSEELTILNLETKHALILCLAINLKSFVIDHIRTGVSTRRRIDEHVERQSLSKCKLAWNVSIRNESRGTSQEWDEYHLHWSSQISTSKGPECTARLAHIGT